MDLHWAKAFHGVSGVDSLAGFPRDEGGEGEEREGRGEREEPTSKFKDQIFSIYSVSDFSNATYYSKKLLSHLLIKDEMIVLYNFAGSPLKPLDFELMKRQKQVLR